MSGHGPNLNAAAPQPLRFILDAIDTLGRLDGWLGAGCLAALTCLMLAEVLVRALSSAFLGLADLTMLAFMARPLKAIGEFIPAGVPGAWEYSSYMMAACFTFGAAMTLRAGGHIRVTLILGRLGPGARRWMEGCCALMAGGFTGFLAVAMVRFAHGAYVRGETSISSDTPLWFPQAVIAFGMMLLALQFLARAIQSALGMAVEDPSMKVASVAE